MKIFFETSALCRKYGGISVYVSSLLRILMEQFPECEYHTGFKSARRSAWEEYLQNAGDIMRSGLRIHRKRLPGRLDLSSMPVLRNLTSFSTKGYDIVHITNNLCFPYSMVSSWSNVILTVHDLLCFQTDFPILEIPDYEYSRRNLPLQARAAAGIITVSQFSRKEICRILNLPEEKVMVVYNAPQKLPENFSHAAALDTLAKYGLNSCGYFLSVGSFYPHKNYPMLIRTFLEYAASSSYRGEKLVIAGPRDGLSAPEDFHHLTGGDPRIMLLHNVTALDLSGLYASANGYFQLSFYEGFGIPVIEAMRAGCPVCCTKNSAMTEIAGEAAFPVDPTSPEEIVPVFRLFSERPEEVKKRGEAGFRRSSLFTWERAARETMECYRTIAEKKGKTQ